MGLDCRNVCSRLNRKENAGTTILFNLFQTINVGTDFGRRQVNKGAKLLTTAKYLGHP